MKQQVVVIHGGDTFRSYREYFSYLKRRKIDFERYVGGKRDWKAGLGKALGRRYEVIAPQMPNKMNAQYREWKIWFEKFIPHLKPGVILIGHSLGGIFLAKYLSEHRFPKRIRATFLVAAPYDKKDADYSLASFKLPKTLKKFAKQSRKIFLYHSKDDPVVPFADFKKYMKRLPDAVGRPLAKRGHIGQKRFPELVRDIKNL